MARIALALLVASSATACFEATFSDGVLSCETSRICPAGMACIGDRCVRDLGDDSDAAPADARVPPDASLNVEASCLEHRQRGSTASGIYMIAPGDGAAFEAYCDMDTDGGGWTLLVNNDATDEEPAGCVPRIASTETYVCGQVRVGQDFAIDATNLPFTEMVWATYQQPFEIAGYQRFVWNDSQMISGEFWSLTPDESSVALGGGGTLPIIECQYDVIGGSALVRVANEPPRPNAGAWTDEPMVTIFDMDTNPMNPGKMSFTDAESASGSLNGFDDFQDGGGCSDMFTPKTQRGFASFVMVR